MTPNKAIKDLLSQLAFKYGSDKCPQLKHSYTPFYYDLLKDSKQSIKKVLEIGVGYHIGMEHKGDQIFTCLTLMPLLKDYKLVIVRKL